jgi:hypothetical protein
MKRKCLLSLLYICGVLLLAGWQTPQTPSSIAPPRPSPGRNKFPLGKTIPFKESVDRTDLKHLNQTLRTPQGAVLAFYAALKSNNRRLLRRIISPHIQSILDKREAEEKGYWENWLERRRTGSANRIELLGEALGPTVVGPEHFVVQAVNKDGGRLRIRVMKDGNLWLWDEY